MLEYGASSSFDTRQVIPSKSTGWHVYGRLVGYAMQHKFRLAVSLLFAIVVAVSFSSMIVSVGVAVRVVYGDEAAVNDQVAGLANGLADRLGLAADETEERFLTFVARMREDRVRAVTILSMVLIVLSISGGLSRFFQEYFAGAIGADITVQLGREMFENVMTLSLPFFEERERGEILARFTNDIFMVNRGLVGAFVKLLREPIKALFCLTLALMAHFWLTLTVLVVFPVTGYAIFRIGKKIRKFVRRSLEKIASMVTVVSESVSGIMIIKAFSMEKYETGRIRKELGNLRRHLFNMVKANAAVGPITEVLLIIGLVLFMTLAARAVETNDLDGGELVILFGALAAMMDPVRKLSSVNNLIQISVASAERIFEFIDLKSDIVDRPGAIALPPLKEGIRFENVHFSYNGETEVLKGVDLEIRKGEMVALVGFSGAGKSTMAKLLQRFYDVQDGRITIDGVDVRDATLESLRGQMSMVTQETILFNETIRQNIASGDSEYTTDLIRRAAEAAHATEFIDKLPEGLDTKLGNEGSGLSGGQRQRLAIARAIVRNPAILILDEATSNLDSESEQAIQEAIRTFVAGRTTLVIAHRLSTIQQADRIVVMDDGRVIETGTHRELLEKGGAYKRLYETQFRITSGTDVA